MTESNSLEQHPTKYGYEPNSTLQPEGLQHNVLTTARSVHPSNFWEHSIYLSAALTDMGHNWTINIGWVSNAKIHVCRLLLYNKLYRVCSPFRELNISGGRTVPTGPLFQDPNDSDLGNILLTSDTVTHIYFAIRWPLSIVFIGSASIYSHRICGVKYCISEWSYVTL